jgi:hypothetical protein
MGECKVAWTLVARPLYFGGIRNTEFGKNFSRAPRLRWLWLAWTSPEHPLDGMELSVDEVDAALFAAATRVTVRNGKKALF